MEDRRRIIRNVTQPVSCQGKIPYASPGAAHRAIRRIVKAGRRDSAMVPYKCLYCPGYHIGRKHPRKF